MELLRALGKFVAGIIQTGVPPEMSPEDAKYIRLINMAALLSILVLPVWMIISINEKHPTNLAIEGAGVVINLLVFVLNRQGHHTAARIYYIVMANIFWTGACVITGPGIFFPYGFFIVAGATVLVFPKTERAWMATMILLSVAAYHATLYLHGRVEPIYEFTAAQQGLVNSAIEYTLFVAIVGMLMISRSGALHAEESLKREHEKVARLSKRLGAYLPRQFVESLATTGRERERDFRRRRLTVFFSDVQGFTRWTDRLEPEEVREILNGYLAEMSAIANRWGATIDKFIGDALMIFFGDPVFTSDRDHALRCVKMAMEMQEKMKELRSEWRDRGYLEPLHIRIGINTGYATVGNFGCEDRLNYTTVGSAVNLAARLESACEPDCITLSYATYALIKDEIDCDPSGEIEAKGFTEPVKIYRVKGLKQNDG